ncbi:uncharacterized protein LOC143255313 isoform X2 [Tachypleus tridentatus]
MSLVDLGKQLLESARNGETEQVRNLMASGAPFTTDWLGTSPLHIAAQNGHVSTAELLLRAGISRDARTKVDRTPLHIAAQEGHLDIVELLLKHGADVDAKDMLRMTPLHWAVERGHMDVIRCLITSGANVHAVSKFEKKPADIAADCNRHDILNLLMNMVPQTKSAQAKCVEHEKNSQVKMATPQKKTLLKTIKVELVTSGTTEKTTSGGPITTQACSTKIIPARPVQLHPNLAAFASAIATSGLNNSVKNKHCESDEDTTDQRSTSVLATLAALAEATAPSATVSTTEALQWLETHGITLLPTDTSTIVASALEGGQTITLTEAGKLALDSVRHSRELSEEQKELTTKSPNLQHTSSTISSGQNLIAIVTDQSQLPTLISNAQSTPMMVVGGSAVSTSGKATLKTMEGQKVSKVTLPKATVKPILNQNNSDLRWKQLEKELEEARKEAENYRVQLQQKEQEAEQYRKQLEQIRTNKLQ